MKNIYGITTILLLIFIVVGYFTLNHSSGPGKLLYGNSQPSPYFNFNATYNTFAFYPNGICFITPLVSNLDVQNIQNTGSMRPTLSDQSLLIYTKDISNIKVGDMIYYNTSKTQAIVHRVISITPTGYIVKGDNNMYADSPVNFSQVGFKVVGILY